MFYKLLKCTMTGYILKFARLKIFCALTKGAAVETYTPLTSASLKQISPEPQARAVAPEPRMEEPSRPPVDDALATKAEAAPASKTNGRASLFRSSFEPFGSERNKDVA